MESNWIKTSDNLPKPGDTVLTFPHFKVLPFGNTIDEGLNYDWSDGDFWTFEDDSVVRVNPYPTHWMHLPSPPDNNPA